MNVEIKVELFNGVGENPPAFMVTYINPLTKREHICIGGEIFTELDRVPALGKALRRAEIIGKQLIYDGFDPSVKVCNHAL